MNVSLKPDQYVPWAIVLVLVFFFFGLAFGASDPVWFITVLNSVAAAVLAFSTLGIAIIGFRGLRSWQEELRGKSEYEVAKDLYRACLKLRNALDAGRMEGFNPPEKELGRLYFYSPVFLKMSEREKKETRAAPYIEKFQNRGLNVAAKMNELRGVSVEVETVLGDEAKGLAGEMLDHGWDFVRTVKYITTTLEFDGLEKDELFFHKDELFHLKDILYSANDRSDVMTVSIDETINRIKIYVNGF